MIWFHGSCCETWLESPYYVHVGTEAAALQRIDPDCWDPLIDPDVYSADRARLYVVRLHDAATWCPTLHFETDYLDDDPRQNDLPCLPDLIGVTGRAHHAKVRDGEFDVYPYRNEVEDKGSTSLMVNPTKLELVEVKVPAWS